MITYNYFKANDIVTCKELQPTFSTGTVLLNQNGRVQIKDNVTGLVFYRDEKQIKFVDEKLNNKVIMTPSIKLKQKFGVETIGNILKGD